VSTVIKVENLSKRYRLGVINRDMLYKDLQSSWAKFRGKEDPNAPIGAKHDKRLEHGDEFWALRNVDLEVKEGEILGIIGRNGAGKSTLLKILSQITAPTEGRIKVKGRIASLLEVGTGFHPELTGRENVYLNGAILGMTRKEVRSKFDEIVFFAGIEEFIDTPVKRYSSGMYVRLAFAVAAHLDPEILVVDEVLAVGDASFQAKCVGKMQELGSLAGRTVIFVSHNMPVIERLCSRCCLLDDGSVTQDSDSATVLATYLARTIQQPASDLAARQDRKGNLQVKFIEAFLQNTKGEFITSVLPGEKVKLVVKLEASRSGVHGNLNLAVGVNDPADSRVCHLSNETTGQTILWSGQRQLVVEIDLDSLPFVPGRYSLTFFASMDKEICDWIINGLAFEVAESDFFGTGKLPPKGQGVILCRHSFRVTSR
jgi:lipopolysaccharide transport system ATP-binding protein